MDQGRSAFPSDRESLHPGSVTASQATPVFRLRPLPVLLPLLALGVSTAAAASAAVEPGAVPHPRPRPAVHAPAPPTADVPEVDLPGVAVPDAGTVPSTCALRLAPFASFTPLPELEGPGDCGVVDVVRLEAVTMPDARSVPLDQPATLRCSMAEALTHWVRDDIGPATAAQGSPLAALAAYESYQCRGRNRIPGARLSEHAKGNAIDIVGVRTADGRLLDWSDTAASREFRERIRMSACARFTTVLGPGSDGHHEDHIHVDLAERASGYRICRWEVRDAIPVAEGSADRVPMPPPRPAP